MKIFGVLFLVFAMSFSLVARAKTIVLVHGAWADGSSWSRVIPLLQAKGHRVIAVQNPLSSLADDVTAAKRVLDAQTDGVVLVGHSWGGVVITEIGGHDKVKALVYVAAFAPDVGQSVLTLSAAYPVSPALSRLQIDATGYAWLSPDTVAADFAQDLPRSETDVLAATQVPAAAQCFDDKVTTAAWKTKKSWFVVAENDRVIQPQMQKDAAAKIGATTSVLTSSHVPMLSQPDAVAAVIQTAAESF